MPRSPLPSMATASRRSPSLPRAHSASAASNAAASSRLKTRCRVETVGVRSRVKPKAATTSGGCSRPHWAMA